MEKINIAELLKDCPKGMELDCTMFDDVVFNTVDFGKTIIVTRTNGTDIHLDEYGTFSNEKDAKCVIFPKGKTTWEGFHRPFKDGDVIHICDEYSDATFTYVAILKQIEKGGRIYSHCFYNYEIAEFSTDDYLYDVFHMRFATEEEKEKLLQAIKDNGYKWNAETKTLEKLPLHKFNISTLKPFESKVLVRADSDDLWKPAIFGCYIKNEYSPYFTLGGISWTQCIPYEVNEHLLGTYNDCDEYFKTWE